LQHNRSLPAPFFANFAKLAQADLTPTTEPEPGKLRLPPLATKYTAYSVLNIA